MGHFVLFIDYSEFGISMKQRACGDGTYMYVGDWVALVLFCCCGYT